MNLDSLPLVLADIGDVIGSIVGIIFLIVWVIGQLTGAKKEDKVPPPRQPAPQRPPAGQQAAGVDQVRDQVEDFLRRAGRQQQKAGAGKPAPAARRLPAARDEIEILLEEVPLERQRQPMRAVDKPILQAPRSAPAAAQRRPSAPRGAKPRRETLAEHAEQVDASTRALAKRSPKLGQGLVEADHQFDERLAARLDHRVGSLEGRHAERMQQELPVEAAPTPAAQIAAMLTNPEGIRQAILLNEILRRPTDRWE